MSAAQRKRIGRSPLAAVGIRVLALLLALGHGAVSAQTRSETEAWIIEQCADNVAGLSYSIAGDDLVRRLRLPSSPLGAGVVQQSIPIRRITRIEVVHTERYLSYSLSCDEPCVDHLAQGIADDGPPRRSVLLFEIYRRLDASYPPRMTKALLKLVELHGGRAQVFAKPKPKPKAPF